MINNEQTQNYNELPSTRKLIVSTIIATLVAAVILIVAVLPAEYGIDPTGIGQLIGLKEMGEIKVALEDEIQQELAIEQKTEVALDEEVLPTEVPEQENSSSKTETFSFRLEPGDKTEFKLEMLAGAAVEYSWSVDQGHVNFNTHGDSPDIDYHGYSKGQKVQSDQGSLTAEFAGSHGWFWRNRSDLATTITLEVSGAYGSTKQF